MSSLIKRVFREGFEMNFNILILFVILLQSCFTTKQATIRSHWEVLLNAKPVSCKKVTFQKRMLEILSFSDLFLGKKKYVLVKYKDRKGQIRWSIHEFDGEIDEEYVSDFYLEKTNVYLGSLGKEEDVALVFLSKGKDNSKEIRLLNYKGEILTSFEGLDASLQKVQFIPSSRKSFWLSYKVARDKDSIDDERVQVSYFEIDSKGLVSKKNIDQSTMSDEVKMALGKDGSMFIAWKERNKNNIYYRKIDSQFSLGNIYELKPNENNIESWGVSQTSKGFVVFAVRGDTLLWEDAKLTIEHFDLDGAQASYKEVDIVDEHMSDPTFAINGNKTYLTSIRWLDAERTLSILDVSDSLKNRGYFGVFPEGRSKVSLFVASRDQTIYKIMKQIEGFSKLYTLCRIDL